MGQRSLGGLLRRYRAASRTGPRRAEIRSFSWDAVLLDGCASPLWRVPASVRRVVVIGLGKARAACGGREHEHHVRQFDRDERRQAPLPETHPLLTLRVPAVNPGFHSWWACEWPDFLG